MYVPARQFRAQYACAREFPIAYVPAHSGKSDNGYHPLVPHPLAHPRFKRRWVCRLPCTPLQPERPHRRQSAYTHQPIARRVRVFFRLALCSIPEIDLHPPLHTLEKEKPRYLFNSGESFVCMVPER